MKLVRFTEAMIIFQSLHVFLDKEALKDKYKVAERLISLKKNRKIFRKIQSANADMSNV